MIRTIFIFTIIFFATQIAQAKYIPISKNNSKVNWKGSKGIKALGEHYGEVGIKDAKVDINEKGLIQKAQITMNMKEITNDDLGGALKDQLLGHLKSKDFFDVEQYQTAEFKSKSVKYLGENKYKISGDLTIKGITRPTEFIGSYSKNKDKHNFVGEFKFDRTSYKIRYGSGQFFTNLGDKMIHDEVIVGFNLETK